MNTTPFYELHDRLYDRASAGCASIAEDFRLKRAVENMAPLAEANKTFARLGNMCAKLFTEPEPALLLAECDESLLVRLYALRGGLKKQSVCYTYFHSNKVFIGDLI